MEKKCQCKHYCYREIYPKKIKFPGVLGCYYLLGLIKKGEKAEVLYFAGDKPIQARKYISQGVEENWHTLCTKNDAGKGLTE